MNLPDVMSRDEWLAADGVAGGGETIHPGARRHGLSCFLRVDDSIHHTYSTYGRGPNHHEDHCH